MILIISGPTGAGKGTVINEILKSHPDFVIPSSYTTRPPRTQEGTKKKYIFVSEDEFHQASKEEKILEGIFEHLWWYGTDKASFEAAYKAHKNILMELEPRGALAIKKLYPQSVLVFLVPDSIDDLERRITADKHRLNMTEQELKVRLESAKRELAYAKEYNFQIKNPQGHPDQAIGEIEKIIQEHSKQERRV